MASPAEKMLTISCPGCGGRFRVPVAAAGRRGRCARCGAALVIAAPAQPPPAQRETSTAPTDAPQLIAVECHVCQTLMYGRLEHVGKRLKCPDCGGLTVVPPPPKPKARRIPKAMEGEQYELWDADHQPLPSELKAAQPVYIAVECRECQTLMYATVDQVGRKMKCPDCGTLHVVPAPPEPKRAKPLVLDDAYAIDPAADPGERPPVILPPTRKMECEERAEAEYAQAREKSLRTGKPMEVDARGRPIMPRAPLVTGVVGFLFSTGVVARWAALSGSLMLIGGLAQMLSLMSSGPFGAIAAVCFLVAAVIIGLIWTSAAASFAIAIITQSSEGNKRIEYWPGLVDWFATLLYVLVALPVSVFPGWLASRLVTDSFHQTLCVGGSLLVCFPLVLLSQLEISSPWAIVSGKVLGSLLRRPVSWMVLYIESALLAAGCGGVFVVVLDFAPGLVLLTSPVYVAAGLIYSRLLGRLAWCIAESSPSGEES